MAADQWVMMEEPQPIEQQKLFEETHKRMELVRRVEHMMLTIVKTQVIIERFMIGLLEAHDRDQHCFFTRARR
ncbi:hypothetical protein [Bradyrhizobium sp. CB3481]|uniref:hypothetical protein n=1 Tax=Bradyrhizobium sp. CB3481 TaxID=3039158 RepID=UPI0024B1A164|nr:hypothetical protein [Bradyrhizobium sp. CB3481]WFU20779.1 hypothetical protein QA643_25140 [Bradyrhizobium sp. CB3481]